MIIFEMKDDENRYRLSIVYMVEYDEIVYQLSSVSYHFVKLIIYRNIQ